MRLVTLKLEAATTEFLYPLSYLADMIQHVSAVLTDQEKQNDPAISLPFTLTIKFGDGLIAINVDARKWEPEKGNGNG